MGWSILYLLSFKHHWPLAMIQLNCVVASTAPTVWLLNSIPFRIQYLIWTSILIQPKILKEAKLHGKTESALLMRWYSTTYEQSWKKTVKIRQCCNFFSFVQIRLNNSASSIVQAQISHPFLLLLKPSLGAEWIVEWKEFLSKVPVCRATLPPLQRLASPRPAAARSSSADILWMTWRVKLCLNSSQVRNLSFDQESFHKICLRAAPPARRL